MDVRRQDLWRVDDTKASVARVYDYLLGGKDNFAIDRVMGDNLRQAAPDVLRTVRTIKHFGARATEYIARQGVRQFVDLGSGIPTTPPSVHDVARAVSMDCRVVYVDHDPVVVAHSRALRDVGPGLVTIHADLEDPDSVLEHDELLRHIDFDKPVGLLIISVLQFIPGTAHVQGLVRRYTDRMAPGSFLAVAHASADCDPAAVSRARQGAAETGYPTFEIRDDDEIGRFFAGFDLVDPGLVDIQRWRPDPDAEGEDALDLTLRAGVGRKR